MRTTRRAVLAALAFAALAAWTFPAPARADVANLDAIKKRGTLKVGVKYDAPPFGALNPKTQKPEGFDVEIARAISKQIFGSAEKVEFVQVTSSNRIPLLSNGDIDMFAATATITPERLKTIDFSNVYFRAGQSLLVKKGSSIKSYKDLAGKSVCTVSGSTPEQTIRRLVPTANVQTFETYGDCFTGLRNGRIDAMTTDNGILIGYEQQDPSQLELVGGLFTFEPYGLGIAKGNTTLKSAVDAALEKIAKDGQYAAIYKSTLGRTLPSDWKEWFDMPTQKAAEQFAAEAPKK